jgi:hypothetical protein
MEKFLKVIFLLMCFSLTSVYSQNLERICVQKEINDDNIMVEMRGGTYLLKKWSLRFSPLSFESKCFNAEISPMFVNILFEDRDPIKWTIEQKISDTNNQRNSERSGRTDCYQSNIVRPSPFLGNGGELIQLSDGSIWQENSYQYLYLYEYSPSVYICPSTGKMILKSKTFSVSRVR